MIGFGMDNEEFGKVPPSIISCEEISDDEGFADNALLIKMVTYTGIKLLIRFPEYIMHLTRNESFTAWDEAEHREGNYLIVFTQSEFINYYDKVIIHTADYSWPGKGTHYGIYAADHLIDIISNESPIITLL